MAGKQPIPVGLLDGLGEIYALMQSDGVCWEVAQERWLKSRREPETNVIAVDFKGDQRGRQGIS